MRARRRRRDGKRTAAPTHDLWLLELAASISLIVIARSDFAVMDVNTKRDRALEARARRFRCAGKRTRIEALELPVINAGVLVTDAAR